MKYMKKVNKVNKQYEALEKACKETLEFYKKKGIIQVLDFNEQNGMSRLYLAFKSVSNR